MKDPSPGTVLVPEPRLPLAVFGFHHHSKGEVKFGEFASSFHSTTSLGLMAGKTVNEQGKKDSVQNEVKPMEKKQSKMNTQKLNKKFSWRTGLLVLLCALMPLV